ncbi:hypothetical protein EVAR_740_1 [Eumeta japonica]|uniref:Uncharacterized protein n=1 Tax=Eumeta variegata TaxID=151549 RepID=A0A4C1SC33_EUMVA|nr:hypothetical protein EVAR_740_1 [Eumeta japonica]
MELDICECTNWKLTVSINHSSETTVPLGRSPHGRPRSQLMFYPVLISGSNLSSRKVNQGSYFILTRGKFTEVELRLSQPRELPRPARPPARR